MIWPSYSQQNVNRAVRAGSEMGKDQFLRLLVAQLQNQDPLQPMDNTEYISQLAQFSALEQMSNVAAEVRLLRQSMGMASSLIGKQITWTVMDSTGQTKLKTGIVEAISFKDGNQYAIVGGETVPLDRLVRVEEPKPDAEQPLPDQDGNQPVPDDEEQPLPEEDGGTAGEGE
jgi:flagellar basal-body rod modification protein FlgD